MARYRTDLVKGQPLPESFLRALMEFTGTLDANLVVTKASATTIQVVGGANSAQVALGIDGLYRYNAATVTAAMPATPSAGTYDIYAVASANSFASTPAPDTDNTDYSFGLQIVTAGGTPSGTWNGKAISNYRKIGTLAFDGTQITSVNQTVGSAGATGTAGGDLAGSFPNPTIKPSVALTGAPTSVTPAALDNSTAIATTAYVVSNAANATSPMNGTAAVGTSARFARQDHVHPTDTTRAALASPTFTGVPAAPTAALDTNTTQIATTAFVIAQAGAVAPVMNGTAAVGTSLRFSRQDHVHPSDTSRAPLASPTFTGVPAAPTAAVDTATTQVATTAYVVNQGYLKSATAGTTYAPLASPTFTGIPAGPTATVDTNTTQLATTAYVVGQGYAKLASPTFTGTVTVPTLAYTTAITLGGSAVADSSRNLYAASIYDTTGASQVVRTGVSALGFYGVVPVARPAARTISNPGAAVRTIDRNAFSIATLFDFVATMATDLQASGLFA